MSDDTLDPEADADFLALSSEQRRKVDAAFDRGLQEVYQQRPGEATSKRRKVQQDDDDATGGGSMVEEEEEEQGVQQRGGSRLPFSHLPAIMASIDLPWDDEVLGVFRSVASLPGDEGQGRQSESLGEHTSRRDFRAVCAALMGPADESEEQEEEEQGRQRHIKDVADDSAGGGFVLDNHDGDEDVDMEPPADDDDEDDSGDEYRDDDQHGGDGRGDRDLNRSSSSELSSAYSDSGGARAGGRPATSSGAPSTRRRARRGAAAQQPPADAAELAAGRAPTRRLSREEKEWVGKMWETMFEGAAAAGQTHARAGGPRMLGRQEIKRWAELLGESWTDQEVSVGACRERSGSRPRPWF